MFSISFPILLDLHGFPKDPLSNSTRFLRRFARISFTFPFEFEQICKDILNNSLLVLLEAPESSLGFSFGFPFYFHSVCKGVLRMFSKMFYRISFNNFLWISFRFPFIIIGCGPRKPSPEAPTCPPHSTPQAQLNFTKTSKY